MWSGGYFERRPFFKYDALDYSKQLVGEGGTIVSTLFGEWEEYESYFPGHGWLHIAFAMLRLEAKSERDYHDISETWRILQFPLPESNLQMYKVRGPVSLVSQDLDAVGMGG